MLSSRFLQFDILESNVVTNEDLVNSDSYSTMFVSKMCDLSETVDRSRLNEEDSENLFIMQQVYQKYKSSSESQISKLEELMVADVTSEFGYDICITNILDNEACADIFIAGKRINWLKHERKKVLASFDSFAKSKVLPELYSRNEIQSMVYSSFIDGLRSCLHECKYIYINRELFGEEYEEKIIETLRLSRSLSFLRNIDNSLYLEIYHSKISSFLPGRSFESHYAINLLKMAIEKYKDSEDGKKIFFKFISIPFRKVFCSSEEKYYYLIPRGALVKSYANADFYDKSKITRSKEIDETSGEEVIINSYDSTESEYNYVDRITGKPLFVNTTKRSYPYLKSKIIRYAALCYCLQNTVLTQTEYEAYQSFCSNTPLISK